ncbi:hypothetical protein MKZ38_006200 [Zalerion maritima]|uniref:Uncharacterized protein n=1 Tax=Zalerion maritima TaxID=339359 RepID=A0AAD5RJR4_9PEZI|nr:hypothetical protein MKZ38_006200 [Zalerion maritima]
MNTRQAIEETARPAALSVSINSDASCFSVGLDTGFCKVYISKSSQLKQSRDFNGGFGLVQMMGTSNMIGLVGGGKNPRYAPTKVMIWDDSKAKWVAEIPRLRNLVRGLQLCRSRIVVVMQNRVEAYTFERNPKLLVSYETETNLLGLCALTDNLLAFPGRTVGQVQIVHLATDSVSIIPAHETALQAIALTKDGEYVATASERGTLINVYSTSSSGQVASFRRGADFATMFSLAFSPSGSTLACTSDKSTLHLFDIGKYTKASGSTQNTAQDGGQVVSKWGVLSKIPLMPRIFRDEYSFVSAPFDAGDEPLVGGLPMSYESTLGTSRPAKGIIGWINEENLIVVGAGKDARWEKFAIKKSETGPVLIREGWKRYLGSS